MQNWTELRKQIGDVLYTVVNPVVQSVMWQIGPLVAVVRISATMLFESGDTMLFEDGNVMGTD